MPFKKFEKESEDKLGKKKSIKTKTSPEENKIVKFQDFIENNRKLVISFSVGVIAVTILFFVVRGFLSKKSEENTKMASVAISRILPYYVKGDYQKSLYGDSAVAAGGQKVIGLVDIINEYGSTDQVKTAALFAGNCFLNQQNGKQAEKYFEQALDADSKLIQMGANAGIGASKELGGDYKSAINYYKKAIELAGEDNDSKYRYMYYAGLCFEKSGDNKSAEEEFRDIIAQTQYSDYANYAKVGLTRLGTIIE
jgi:tetratricopeptide (TPR) repeat protein